MNRLAETVANTASDLRELEGKTSNRWKLELELSRCQQATAWSQLVNDSQDLLTGVAAIIDFLDSSPAEDSTLEIESDSESGGAKAQCELLSRQLKRSRDFFQVFLARTPATIHSNHKDVIYWVSVRSDRDTRNRTIALDLLEFNKSALLPIDFLSENWQPRPIPSC